MDPTLTRRSFNASGLAAAAAAGLPLPPRTRRFRKAVKLGMVTEGDGLRDKFALVAEAGFDGIELDSPNDFDDDEVLAARDETGLTIHGVVDSVHWGKPLSHPEADVRAQGVEALRTALRDAHTYGADTVLLVPAVVNARHTYADAYRRSQDEIGRVLPLAAELGVHIALENVWNNFLLSPLECARYIDELSSPWIGAYLDCGNLVRFAWPVHWIEVLGPRILKVDVKDYSREKQQKEGLWKGFDVAIGDGDTDWPAAVEALEAVGYEGWFTAEVGGGGRARLGGIARRMDAFLP